MEIKVLESAKNEMKIELESLAIAEILRVYLNKDSSVTLAAWRRDHPTEKPTLLVKTKGKTPKKAIDDSVSQIIKEIEKFDSDFKNLK